MMDGHCQESKRGLELLVTKEWERKRESSRTTNHTHTPTVDGFKEYRCNVLGTRNAMNRLAFVSPRCGVVTRAHEH